MGKFCVRLKDEFYREGEKFALGTITLGPFSEDFHASLSYWSRSDYERQWRGALQRLMEGAPKSALVTSMYEPAKASFIFWWPMFLENGKIHVQNGVLFLDQVEGGLVEDRIYVYVPDRITVDEDGHKVSEWELTKADVEEYLRKMGD